MEKGAVIAIVAVAAFLFLSGTFGTSKTEKQADTKPPISPPSGLPSEIDLNRILRGDFQYLLDISFRYGPEIIAKINQWWKTVDRAGWEKAQLV